MLRKSLLTLVFLAVASPLSAKTVEIWIEPNGPNPQGILEERLELFKKETGIDGKVVVLEWGDAWKRINEALDAQRGPDVLQLGSTWVSHLAASGKLASLERLSSAIRPERFTFASWKTTMVDGDIKPFAVPWFLDVRVLMGNRKWLTAQGIQGLDLSTADDFRGVLSKLRQAHLMREDSTPVYPFAFSGKSDWNLPHNFAPWIWSQGGDFIGKSNGKWSSRLLEKNTVIGIRRYVGFVVDGLVSPGCIKEDAARVGDRFVAGEHVFSIGPSEVISRIRLPDAQGGIQGSPLGRERIQTFPIPGGPGGSVAFVGGSDLAIPSHKAKSQAAIKLLLFLIRPDNLDKYTKQIGFLSPDKDILRTWAADPEYRVVVEQAEHGRTYPSIRNWEEIEAALVKMFGEVWASFDSPGGYRDEALYKILVEYDAIIDSLLGTKRTSPLLTWDEFQAAVGEIPELADVDGSRAKMLPPPLPPSTDYVLIVLLVLGVLALAGIGYFVWRTMKQQKPKQQKR